MRIGFIGVGTIATAMVTGLMRGGGHEIVLSPRSEKLSSALAARCEGVTRASSNAAVAEASDLIFLAMRPSQVDEALRGVAFRPGQHVASFVTGLALHDLAILAPGATVCRVLPLPCVERGVGPIVCCPPVAPIATLLAGLGDLIPVESQEDLLALGAVSGFMSSYFEVQRNLIDWLQSQQVAQPQASLYVRSMLAGLAGTALGASPQQEARLVEEHETKGGLNERVRRRLSQEGWFSAPSQALADIRAPVRSELG